MSMPLVLTRCTIREWRLEDAESVVRHANNRQVWLTLRDVFPHPYTMADAKEFLARTVAANPATNFCIEVAGSAVGEIGLHLQTDVHRYSAEFGYWLGQEFCGRGIMTEAVAAFSKWALDSFRL